VSDVRPSPIAGTWYSRDPEVLTQTIDHQLESCEVEPIPGSIIGVVSPHAGHRYSGHVAAYAFRCLMECDPDVVVVLSPLHYHHPAHVVATGHDAYATPLGLLPVHHELLDLFGEDLAQTAGLDFKRVRNDNEHSLEIELPFLQRALPGTFQLLPLMLSDQSRTTAEAVGRSLATVVSRHSAIIVASTDLSHFYPQPVAEGFDKEVLSRLEAFDPAGLLSAEEEGVGFACGRGAMAAALWAARELGADRVRILKYATSGDVTGDFTSVVGYGAAVIFQQDEG
jgi:AmmeMemoRadiSam system protein B